MVAGCGQTRSIHCSKLAGSDRPYTPKCDEPLIAVVEQGTLTHYAAVHPGGVREYHAGDSIIEGNGYPHEGRNEGDTDVVLLVTYVTPEGQPLAETDLSLCTLTAAE